MDGDTAKNLISRIRNADMDEEAQNEAIQKIKAERNDSRPAAVVGVSTEEDGMGGNVRLSMGERTPVEVAYPSDPEEDTDDVDPTDARTETLFLTLNRLNGDPALGEGDGSSTAYDDALLLADYHLTYGQGKALLRLVEPDEQPGTPGDVESRLRHVLGSPDEVNPLFRDIQENGVRGWRRVENGKP